MAARLTSTDLASIDDKKTVHAAVRAAAQLEPAGRVQAAVRFRPDGSTELVDEPASNRRYTRKGMRDDARRTAEYLASRGITPVEALHNVIRSGWRRIHRDVGCTKLEAFKLWVAVGEMLLPYTAARLAQIELTADAGATSLGMAHFLAASAMSQQMQSLAATDHLSSDKPQTIDLQREFDDVTGGITAPGLPPKSKD